MRNVASSILNHYPILGTSKIASESQIRKERLLSVGILFLILFPLEITAGIVAWETEGEGLRAIYILACIAVNTIAITLALTQVYLTSIIMMVAFGLLLIWHQVPLTIRMHYVGAEAANIVSWAYSERLKTGKFPENLSGYVYLHPGYAKYIQIYEAFDNDNFRVVYYVSSTDVSRQYSSEGGWYYYPD
jgi:hypothetical protein